MGAIQSHSDHSSDIDLRRQPSHGSMNIVSDFVVVTNDGKADAGNELDDFEGGCNCMSFQMRRKKNVDQSVMIERNEILEEYLRNENKKHIVPSSLPATSLIIEESPATDIKNVNENGQVNAKTGKKSRKALDAINENDVIDEEEQAIQVKRRPSKRVRNSVKFQSTPYDNLVPHQILDTLDGDGKEIFLKENVGMRASNNSMKRRATPFPGKEFIKILSNSCLIEDEEQEMVEFSNTRAQHHLQVKRNSSLIRRPTPFPRGYKCFVEKDSSCETAFRSHKNASHAKPDEENSFEEEFKAEVNPNRNLQRKCTKLNDNSKTTNSMLLDSMQLSEGCDSVTSRDSISMNDTLQNAIDQIQGNEVATSSIATSLEVKRHLSSPPSLSESMGQNDESNFLNEDTNNMTFQTSVDDKDSIMLLRRNFTSFNSKYADFPSLKGLTQVTSAYRVFED